MSCIATGFIGKARLEARVKRSETREFDRAVPDCAALHPDYWDWCGPQGISTVIASAAKQSMPQGRMDCFVAEPVIGRAFARRVGSSQ
jgi:hypothetical protein